MQGESLSVRQPNFFILPFAFREALEEVDDAFQTPTRRYVSALRPLAHLIATFRGQETSSKVATFSVGCTVETYDYPTRSN